MARKDRRGPGLRKADRLYHSFPSDVTLPKVEKAKPRQIELQVASK